MNSYELYEKVISLLEENDERIPEIRGAFRGFIKSENDNIRTNLTRLARKLENTVEEVIEDIESDIFLEEV